MKKFLLAAFAFSLSTLAQAQTLEPDPTFGTNGTTVGAIPGNFTQFYAIKKTANESFICLGSEEDNNGSTKAFLAKYTSSGTLDNSFGTNGIVKFNDADTIDNYYFALNLQSDGKILVGGSNQDQTTTENTFWVKRYNANGTIDNTFGNNGSAEVFNNLSDYGYIPNVSIQADGKILISFGADSGIPGVTRLNADGSLDNTFGTNGLANPGNGINGLFYSYVKALDNGKLLVAAYINDILGSGYTSEIIVYGLNSNGTADLAFGVNGKFNYTLPGQDLAIQNLNLQSDGKIIIGGYNYDPNSSSADTKVMLIRLLTNGSPDNTFGTQGVATMVPESGDIETGNVYVLNDDQLIVNYGNYDSLYSGLVKFTANGTPDVSFNDNNAVKIVRDIELGNLVGGIEVQSDQKIVFAGTAATGISGSDFEYKSMIGRLRRSGMAINTPFKDMATIYPNPAKDKLYIDLKKHEATATVFDLSGKKVLEQKIYRTGTLNLGQLNSGTYLLDLHSGAVKAAQQFTVIK